ncbi:NAD(P)-dependent oxidoreductase [candidate division WS5 bacterium]|uniref:NAD(P)-dependent oxidoreductase n=1 Tax=candidate division WS5 bacterium TaxID=2093353 RepID=A0A419DB01_9BACT|nr:MAG: NAD(P)-dependent oxidoreductase [candidate division WS5 bacterium]
MYSRKRIVVTGSQGNIGSIIFQNLSDKYNLVGLDKLDGTQNIKIDLTTDLDRLEEGLSNCDVVIHLAWDNGEDFPNEVSIPENKIMAENLYKAVASVGTKRLIIASSVHANNYRNLSKVYIKVSSKDIPDTPYGASKLYIENLGKFYASRYGTEVICIRFGGIINNDEVRIEEDPLYANVLLYKADAIDLLIRCINKKNIPNGFTNFYAVSNNKNRLHSIKNNVGWKPKLP